MDVPLSFTLLQPIFEVEYNDKILPIYLLCQKNNFFDNINPFGKVQPELYGKIKIASICWFTVQLIWEKFNLFQ